MAIKVSRVSTHHPKAPAANAVAVATGHHKTSASEMIPEGTSTDAVAALVGRYKKARKGGKGCCPGKRGY
jgi:hypothetical protein